MKTGERADVPERTLAIIKPDACGRDLIGPIVALAESKKLSVIAMKRVQLSRREAEGFYHIHREKPFFQSLIEFMCEGPVVLMVLQGDNAITVWREIMGATDPAKAAEGTVRRLFGESIERNSVHGSDGPGTAAFEIGYFFSQLELVPAS